MSSSVKSGSATASAKESEVAMSPEPQAQQSSAASADLWDALLESLPEPELTENAVTVLRSRYLRRNEDGEVIEISRNLSVNSSQEIEVEALSSASGLGFTRVSVGDRLLFELDGIFNSDLLESIQIV